MKFSEADNSINQIYDEAYISVFTFENEDYYIEYNEIINMAEADKIQKFVVQELNRINE